MNKFYKIVMLCAALFTIVLFQAFDLSSEDSDRNPNLDRPPHWVYDMRKAYQHYEYPMTPVTTPDGFTNYYLGIDFAEGHIAQNPRNPLWSFMAFNINGTHYTTDGGLNWGIVNPGYPNASGDPVVAYDSLGNLYYDNMKSPITGTWIAKSTNNGQSWLFANVTGNTGNDKNWIACDQTAGPYANFVYGSMTNGSQASFSRSTNGGTSFSLIGNLTPHNLPGTMPCVGPNGSIQGGSVYVVTNSGSAFTPDYSFFRSTNGGATLPTLMSTQSGWVNTVGTQSGGRNSVHNMRTRPYPYIAADNSYGPYRGRLYCIYAANDPPGNGNRPDIWCRYSTDFGATFSSAIRINDDPNTQNNNQWHPAVWCDKETGRVYVQWMDTRNCPTTDSAEIYASFSSNGGVSWVTNQKISNAKMKIDCATCGGGGTPRYQGDYNGITSNSQGSALTWADWRNGSFGSYFAYFPDFALRVTPVVNIASGTNDSGFAFVSVPAVKLFTLTSTFSATVVTPPGTGSFTLTLLNRSTPATQNTLSSYPDSLRLRIRTNGGVPNGAYTIRVVGNGPNGTPVHFRTLTVNVGPVAIGHNNNNIPEKFFLYQNYPNPFNPSTKIRFDLPKAGFVKLNVYDLTGRLVTSLLNSRYEAGEYSYNFNAENLSAGVYFYKLETPEYTSVRKMILVK